MVGIKKKSMRKLIGGFFVFSLFYLVGDMNVLAAGSVEITEANFPDANFRQWVSDECDSDKNGILEEAEINDVTSIDVRGKGIQDLTGVKYFSRMLTLDCGENQLTSLDVSGLTNLSNLYCDGNHLTSLDTSGLTDLDKLSCNKNQLTSLDMSGLTDLFNLDCSDNQLTSLDVGGLTNLYSLTCYNNQLTSLDVGGLANLKELSCGDNQLTSLDVSGLTNLYNLYCYNNQLTSLDVRGSTDLFCLNCNDNQLTSLDVRGLTNLDDLDCSENQLTSLDVRGLTNLDELVCYDNQLTSLDVGGLTNLEFFLCFKNTVNITGRQLDMSQYDKNFDMSKVSNLKDMTLNQNIFTIADDCKSGTYDYDCGNGYSMTVTIATTTEDAPGAIFSDVPSDAWYADAVGWAYDNGVMNGVGNNNFNPMGSTTRAMVVQILYNIAGTPAVTETRDFTDVTPGAWYVNAVQWAATTGVTSGVSATEFAPERDVTRQEVAVFLYQYAKRQGYDTCGRNDLSGFSDSSEVAGWATEAMQWANHSGIINGKGTVNPKLDPQGTATRAEIATMMRGFMTKYN